MKSIRANYFFSIFKSVMSVIFPLISFPYASRVLGVSNIGIVSYCTSVISYFTLFAGLGVTIYATREGAKIRDDEYELSKFSREVFVINIISTSVVYFVFLMLLYFKTFNEYFVVMLICSFAIWFTTLGVEWLYQIEEEYSYISMRSLVFQAISLVMLFVMVKSKQDYVKYAFIQVFATGGSCVLNLWHSKKYINFFQSSKIELKRHLKPIFIIFGISASSSIYINIDVVMLRLIHSEYEVGLYTAAVKAVNMVRVVINSLSMVLMSRLSNYAEDEKNERYIALLKNAFSVNLSLAIPCAIGMFMISKSVLVLLSGMAYVGANTASKFLAVNVIFGIADGMIYYQILIPNRKDVVACVGTTIGAIMNLLLNLLLIPNYGIDGAAIATVLSEMCVFVSFYYIVKRKMEIRGLFQEVPKILISSIPIVICCIISYRVIDNNVVAMIVAVVLSAVLYFALLYKTKGILMRKIVGSCKRILLLRRK